MVIINGKIVRQLKMPPVKKREPPNPWRKQRRLVFKGKQQKLRSGLRRTGLVKNRRGRIVSAKLSERGKKSVWCRAVSAARRRLGLKGMHLLKKGGEFYKEAKKIQRKLLLTGKL